MSAIDPLNEHFATKREVSAMFGQIRDHLKRQDRVLDEINRSAKETNGRVRRLEIFQAKIEGGQLVTAKSVTVATAFGSVIAGVVLGHYIH